MVPINTTATRKHVGEIERYVRVVKERCRCIVLDLPFQYLHKLIVVRLVYFAVMMLNVPILASNYRVITGKYRRILRFLVFLLRYGLYRGNDGIIVRRRENSG